MYHTLTSLRKSNYKLLSISVVSLEFTVIPVGSLFLTELAFGIQDLLLGAMSG